MRLTFLLALFGLSSLSWAQPHDSAHADAPGSVAGGMNTIAGFEDTLGTGRSVPAFVFRSLDDSSYVSHATLIGKVYLVDFWATWCPPCVEALPELEKIHREFRARGFEIVSLSFDNSDERIRQFRVKRFAMPWLHGRLEGGFSDIVTISFEVQNIPHYVLVGRDGSILAEADELPADELRALLSEIIGSNQE